MWSGMLHKLFKVRDKVAMNLGAKEDEEKPFLEHLEDLRTMLVRIVTTLVVSTIATFVFYGQLFEVIKGPLWFAGVIETQEQMQAMLQILSPQEGFMMMVNISLIAAVIISFPLLLVFILQFIMPGLRDNERKLLWPALGIGAGLFLTGICFSYFVVLPRALDFFYGFNESLGLGNGWRLNEYVTFATRFILIFGISFELPVVVMALVKLDFLSYQLMSRTRKHAIIVIAIFSAVITPTQDVLTLMLLAGPLYILYEICIWLARAIEKKERQLYPEFYAEQDADQKAIEEGKDDDWDNPDYNPWFGGDDDDDDDDLIGGSGARPHAGTPPEKTDSEAEAGSSETPEPTPEDSTNEPSDSDAGETPGKDIQRSDGTANPPETPQEPKPDSEKTLEDFSKDDESKSGS